ncbi:NUDIX hydrolase [Agrobacterium rubi]|nr:NUDIX hydrolase [Agrobacterium rubi]NTF24972.1 NUDIX hydrolase [Agrobacterium rubi]
MSIVGVTEETGARESTVGVSSLLRALASNSERLHTAVFRQQYAALCFRLVDKENEVQVLVITSRDTGRWVIPKGWPMKRKKPHEAAAIEALQEAGVRGKPSKKPIGQYTYMKRLDSGVDVPCIVDVFKVEISASEAEYKEKGQRTLEWVSPAEASRRVQEPELKSLLASFRRMPRKRSA